MGRLETTPPKTCGRCLTTLPSHNHRARRRFFPSIDIITGAPLPKDAEVDPAISLMSKTSLIWLRWRGKSWW